MNTKTKERISEPVSNGNPDSPTITKHMYDIEVFGIYDDLKKKFANERVKIPNVLDNYAFFEMQEKSLLKTFKSAGIDLSENQEYRLLILHSSYDAYFPHLGWKILTIEADEIDGLLSYQAKKFHSSKEDFCGLVEFNVRQFVKSNNFLNETKPIEEIKNWLKNNRVFKKNNKTKVIKEYDSIIRARAFCLDFIQKSGKVNFIKGHYFKKKEIVKFVEEHWNYQSGQTVYEYFLLLASPRNPIYETYKKNHKKDWEYGLKIFQELFPD